MKFKEKCYEKYKLKWMLDHDHTLSEIETIMKNGYMEAIEFGYLKDDCTYNDVFGCMKTFFNDYGFEGEIFASFDEFLKTEYKDKNYMKNLLSEEMYKEYEKKINTPVYKITLTKSVEVYVEAENEEKAVDWAREHTPYEAEQLSERAIVSYDEYVEKSNEVPMFSID